MNAKGYLALVLHAHLPFVRHPEHEDHLEERWLFEAITETYIPILRVYKGLMADGIPFKVTMSVTPSLANMLADKLLQERYRHHLELLIELAEKEMDYTSRTEGEKHFFQLAEMYHKLFLETRVFWDSYQGNILKAFKEVADTGQLEIITCGATHGFLPLYQQHPESIRAQVMTGVDDYERHFGRRPRGIWLPECGYFPGLDRFLAEADIQFFLVDTHGINNAKPKPARSVYAPLITPWGVAAFGRDQESSKQVWSSEEGYPGDAVYREFYRDAGFDRPMDYIRKYIHPDGIRLNTGIKYYRLSGKGDLKYREPYNRQWALDKAASHAGNFMFNREKQIDWLHGQLGQPPIIVAPYDAELFGHWWFEGPDWINFLFRKVNYDQSTFELTTPFDYLEKHPMQQVAFPAASSWGDKGYYEVWCNGGNDWIYPPLHRCSDRMTRMAEEYTSAKEIEKRVIRQAMRELLLAESSDWAFIITTATAVEYARQRTLVHIERFNSLFEMLLSGNIDEGYLGDIEYKDNIFPQINPLHFKRR